MKKVIIILSSIILVIGSVLTLKNWISDASEVKSSGAPGPNPGIQTPQTYANNVVITVGTNPYTSVGVASKARSYGMDSAVQSNGNIVSVGVGQGNLGDYAGQGNYISPNHSDGTPITSNAVYNSKVIISDSYGNKIRVIPYSHEYYNITSNMSGGDGLFKVVIDPVDDSIYCIGNIRNQDFNATTYNSDGVLVKYDKHGNFLWDVEIGGSGEDYISDGYLGVNGNFYLYGKSSSTDGMFSSYSPDTTIDYPFVVEISKTQINEAHMHDDDMDSQIALGASGFSFVENLHLISYSSVTSFTYLAVTYDDTLNRHIATFNDDDNHFVATYNDSFVEQERWQYFLQGGNVLRSDDVTFDGSELKLPINDIYYSNSYNSFSLVGTYTDTLKKAGFMAKLNSDFTVSWQRIIDESDNDLMRDTVITNSGKYVFGGHTKSIFDGTSPNPWSGYTHSSLHNDINIIVFNDDGTFYSSSITSDITGHTNQNLIPSLAAESDAINGLFYDPNRDIVVLTGHFENVTDGGYSMQVTYFTNDIFALNNGIYITG